MALNRGKEVRRGGDKSQTSQRILDLNSMDREKKKKGNTEKRKEGNRAGQRKGLTTRSGFCRLLNERNASWGSCWAKRAVGGIIWDLTLGRDRGSCARQNRGGGKKKKRNRKKFSKKFGEKGDSSNLWVKPKRPPSKLRRGEVAPRGERGTIARGKNCEKEKNRILENGQGKIINIAKFTCRLQNGIRTFPHFPPQ